MLNCAAKIVQILQIAMSTLQFNYKNGVFVKKQMKKSKKKWKKTEKKSKDLQISISQFSATAQNYRIEF